MADCLTILSAAPARRHEALGAVQNSSEEREAECARARALQMADGCHVTHF